MRKTTLLLSLVLLCTMSCSKVADITGNADASYSNSKNTSKFLRIISDISVIATVKDKTYDSKELEDGINVSYGTEIVLEATDKNDYEWIFNDWKAYGDVPHYDASITFNIKRDSVITVK